MIPYSAEGDLLPTVTVIGLEFAFLLGGLVVTEQVFNINGIGLEFLTVSPTEQDRLNRVLEQLSAKASQT